VKFAQDNPEVTDAKHRNGFLRLTTESYGTIDCELTGDYQAQNANTVLVALNMLKRLKCRIKDACVRDGFAHVVENTGLLGRWMELGTDPRLLCDSAHNPSAFEIAMRQLRKERRGKNLHMILGFMADKDVSSMLKLLPGDTTFYFTQAHTSRSMKAVDLQAAAARQGIKGDTYDRVEDALDAARKHADPQDVIYVGGSMYVLAELLKALGYGDQQDV
jgi:dihydrofolate synthase/folylpolyglutamate synthase